MKNSLWNCCLPRGWRATVLSDCHMRIQWEDGALRPRRGIIPRTHHLGLNFQQCEKQMLAIRATGSIAFFKSSPNEETEYLSQQVMLIRGGEDRQCSWCGISPRHLSLSVIHFLLVSVSWKHLPTREQLFSYSQHPWAAIRGQGFLWSSQLPFCCELHMTPHSDQQEAAYPSQDMSSFTIRKLSCRDWGTKDKLIIGF